MNARLKRGSLKVIYPASLLTILAINILWNNIIRQRMAPLILELTQKDEVTIDTSQVLLASDAGQRISLPYPYFSKRVFSIYFLFMIGVRCWFIE